MLRLVIVVIEQLLIQFGELRMGRFFVIPATRPIQRTLQAALTVEYGLMLTAPLVLLARKVLIKLQSGNVGDFRGDQHLRDSKAQHPSGGCTTLRRLMARHRREKE